MPARGVILVQRPEAADTIRQIAESALRRAGAVGVLPTPIDDLVAAAKLENIADPAPFIAGFMARLKEGARETFRAALQKLRGIADLRERAIYVPADTNGRRVVFAKGHELAHQLLPWHNVNMTYQDDDVSLSPDAQECFDQEANFFAAEVIFQGHRFVSRLRDYRPSFEAVFRLADEHGASRHATLRRYVEEHDEAVAMLAYYPSRYSADANGHPRLYRGSVIAASSFAARFDGIELPRHLAAGHPWAVARDVGSLCEGDISLPCAGTARTLQWQAWWNTYALFVLLRAKPVLSLIGGLVRR